MFFFQAEDGIRDAQESRGLGGRDVTPAVITQIVEHLLNSKTGEDLVWIGVKT